MQARHYSPKLISAIVRVLEEARHGKRSHNAKRYIREGQGSVLSNLAWAMAEFHTCCPQERDNVQRAIGQTDRLVQRALSGVQDAHAL